MKHWPCLFVADQNLAVEQIFKLSVGVRQVLCHHGVASLRVSDGGDGRTVPRYER